MFHRTPFFLPWLYQDLTWRMPTREKEIFLTFDDGPIEGATEFALHTLARFSAKATFFCIGDNIQKRPDIFQKIITDGHTIGNHTFNHLKGWSTQTDHYIANIELCELEIEKHQNLQRAPDRIKLFRPPYGRITRKQIVALQNYQIVMWDVLSADYNRALSPHHCLLRTVHATRPGSVVVFHDSNKAERNMTFALPRFIEHFSEKGYAFKAIPT